MSEEDDDICMKLDLEEPSEGLQEIAMKNLNENPDTRVQVLEDFRNLIYERGECTPHRIDDAFLIRFLRARQYILRRAHRLLVNYCHFREKNSSLFDNVRLLNLEAIFNDNVISIPPYREQTGRRLIVLKAGRWQTDKYKIDDIFKAIVCVLELGMLEHQTQILGGICIFDFSGLTLQQAKMITPSIASNILGIMGTSYPVLVQAVHIVYQPLLFNLVFWVFKPFLNSEMLEKIFFHGSNMKNLHKHIEPRYLTEIYGGLRAEYSFVDWLLSLEQDKRVLEEVRSLGYMIKDEDIKELKKKYVKVVQQ